MKTKNKISKKLAGFVFISFILGIFFSFFFVPDHSHSMMDMDGKREHFIGLKNDIIHNLIPHKGYRCCLEKPCVYCIEKTPGHGEGAKCDCLKDVIDGVHPCGECIGEILEGHGNPLLAEYFAKAIAEKVGEQHIGTLKQIISEKYDMPIEEQL